MFRFFKTIFKSAEDSASHMPLLSDTPIIDDEFEDAEDNLTLAHPQPAVDYDIGYEDDTITVRIPAPVPPAVEIQTTTPTVVAVASHVSADETDCVVTLPEALNTEDDEDAPARAEMEATLYAAIKAEFNFPLVPASATVTNEAAVNIEAYVYAINLLIRWTSWKTVLPAIGVAGIVAGLSGSKADSGGAPAFSPSMQEGMQEFSMALLIISLLLSMLTRVAKSCISEQHEEIAEAFRQALENDDDMFDSVEDEADDEDANPADGLERGLHP